MPLPYDLIRDAVRFRGPGWVAPPLPPSPPTPPPPTPPSLFTPTSERGIDPARRRSSKEGVFSDIGPGPNNLHYRVIRLLESVYHYRELDLVRSYTLLVPREAGARPIVQGKTNCIEGLAAIYDAANDYFIEAWTGRRRKLVIKLRRAEDKSCHPARPVPRVERSAAMRIAALENHERIVYSLAVSAVGVRDQWQMFKEDIKPKVNHFDLTPYRLKYFGDLDLDLRDGLYVDISFCECGWHIGEQGRSLELMQAGEVLWEACRDAGSKIKPNCWGCEKIYEVKQTLRKI